jgi:DNA-binding transcriptional LysR family regulator
LSGLRGATPLRYFVAAADERSTRRAAAKTGARASVVSRCITALENELGVSLFERHSAGVRLTEAGGVFLADARRIIADVDRARAAAHRVAVGKAERLRLGVCEDATTPNVAPVAEITAAHRKRCPDVALDLFEVPTAAQAIALQRVDLDVGLVLPPVPSDGLQLDELWQEDWLAALPEGHRLADRAAIDVRDLAQPGFITGHPELGPGCHEQALDLLRATGVEARIVARAFRRTTMLILVRSGGSVTLVPGSFAGSSMDGVVLRPLTENMQRMRVAAAHTDTDLPGVVAQLLRVASDVVAVFGRRRLPVPSAHQAVLGIY